MAPGLSPGILDVVGNYSQTAAGTLAVELNGTTVGTQYDQLNVTGTIALAGTLAVTSGFTPAEGDGFAIVANDAADAVGGVFTGLPETAVVTRRRRALPHHLSRRIGQRHRPHGRARAVAAVAISVDPTDGAGSDGNTVFEPGETVTIKPSWQERGDSRDQPDRAQPPTSSARPAPPTRSPTRPPATARISRRRHGRLRFQLLLPLRHRSGHAPDHPLGRDLHRNAEHASRPAQGLDAAPGRQLHRRSAQPALLPPHRDARPHRHHRRMRGRQVLPRTIRSNATRWPSSSPRASPAADPTSPSPAPSRAAPTTASTAGPPPSPT